MTRQMDDTERKIREIVRQRRRSEYIFDLFVCLGMMVIVMAIAYKLIMDAVGG